MKTTHRNIYSNKFENVCLFSGELADNQVLDVMASDYNLELALENSNTLDAISPEEFHNCLSFVTIEQNNGDVIADGTRYILTQQAFASDDAETYQASALSTYDGSEVTIFWDIIADDFEDESDACDWQAPSLIVDSYSHIIFAA